METKIIVLGHTVSYDASLEAGIRYLARELADDEKRVFFDEAYNRGSAAFEDHMGSRFKLIHDGSEYRLEKHG